MTTTASGLWIPDDLLVHATDEELAEYEAVLQAEAEDLRAVEAASPWTPHPRQAVMSQMARQCDETLVGGAAGGGKTEWLIRYVASLMEAHPNNRGGIFRRVFPALRRTVLPRARIILWGRARYNANDHVFYFPNGSELLLGTMQYEADVMSYAGTEFGVLAYEELTEFAESQYLFMLSRLRSPGPGIRPHVVATTNPPGVGREWVRRRFVRPIPGDFREGDPAIHPDPLPGQDDTDPNVRRKVHPDTPWHPLRPDDLPAEAPDPGIRSFVPSLLDDNPTLEQRDPGYRGRIASMRDTALRDALLLGDWDAEDVVPGALWTRAVIDRDRVASAPPTLTRVGIGVDPNATGTADEAGVIAAGLDHRGHAYVLGDYSTPAGPERWGRRAVTAYDDETADWIVGESNNGGEMVRIVIRSAAKAMGVVPPPSVELVHASRGKIARADPVAQKYHDGMVHHVGSLRELETQQCTWNADSKESPNRLDALVWILTRLFWPKGRDRQRKSEVYRFD